MFRSDAGLHPTADSSQRRRREQVDFSTLAQRNKRLESEGCALVARSLSTNHTVRKLIIRDHAIEDDGAVALSNAVQ